MNFLLKVLWITVRRKSLADLAWIKLGGLIFCLVLCNSCATIRFTQSQPTSDITYQDQIHHITLMGLYEYSDPVSPKKICNEGRLSYVETEHSLATWAINQIPGFMSQSFNAGAVAWKMPWLGGLGALFSLVPILYSPMAVRVACS